jgi:Flp pilus assembly CpaF family ATPase
VATLPPISFRGPALTVRRPEKDRFDFEKLVQYAALSRPMVSFLETCIRFRRPILLTTGPGVSPAATLNAILERLPADDRIVTVESGAELDVSTDRVVTALEPGPDADVEALVALAGRLRADRLVVTDLRGAAAAVFAAASGATAGAAYALAAATPEAAIARLVAEVEGAETGPAEATVAEGAPIIAHEARFSDGSRRVTRICEVLFEDGRLHAEDVFVFRPDGVDAKGMTTGHFAATGFVPRFVEALVGRGEADIDTSMFESRG